MQFRQSPVFAIASRLGGTLALAVLWVVISPNNALAQDCLSVCYHTCQFNLKIHTDGSPRNSPFEPTFQCGYGFCGACGVTEEEDADSPDALALTEMVDAAFAAASSSSITPLIELARLPDVTYNHSRRSLQLRHQCNPAWVAVNIPVPDEFADAVADVARGSSPAGVHLAITGEELASLRW